jgi:hypothetical protein
MASHNRKLGPQFDTQDKFRATNVSLHASGRALYDLKQGNAKQQNINDVDYGKNLRYGIHNQYGGKSMEAVQYGTMVHQQKPVIIKLNGEDYGSDSEYSLKYRIQKPLYNGLKQAFFTQDMEYDASKERPLPPKPYGSGYNTHQIDNDTTDWNIGIDDEDHVNDLESSIHASNWV